MDHRVGAMTDPNLRVVTISAGYGAGASIVGPRVAEQLGLPYLERVFSPSLVRAAAGGEGATREEHSARFLDRLVDSLAGIPLDLGAGAPQPVEDTNADEQVRNEMEAGIETLTRPPGGVVRGRGGMIVLRSCPSAFHVRLGGPRAARIRQAMRLTQIDEREATRRCDETDRARVLYLRRFYDIDADDPTLYHLVMDSTALPLELCTDLVMQAASGFWANLP
jgi:cytidylate kinase